METKNLKIKALKYLAKDNSDKSLLAIKTEAEKVFSAIKNTDQYDVIDEQLELLAIMAHRVSEKTIEIANYFLLKIENLALQYDNYNHEFYSPRTLKRTYRKEYLQTKILDIVGRIRYLQTEEALKIFFNYSTNQTEEIIKKAEELIKNTSKYDINALKRIGFRPQKIIIQELENFSDEDLKKYCQAISIVGKEILSLEMEATYSDYNTVTFSRGVIPINEETKNLRRRAIAILKRVYELCDNEDDKKKILSALEEVSRMPYDQNYSDDLTLLAINDGEEIAKFYLGLIDKKEYIILQKIERYLCWQWQVCKELMEKHQNNNLEIIAAIDRFQKLIAQFRDQLNQDQRFVHFKTLIGYDSIFPEDWNDGGWTWHISNGDQYKTGEIEKYVKLMNQDNWQYWQALILDCIRLNPKEGADYQLRNFLRLISKDCPDFSMKLIKENEDKIAPFLFDLLISLYKSDRENQVKDLMNCWIENGKYLSSCALLIIENNDVGDTLMKKIFLKAVELKDDVVLSNIARCLYRRHDTLENQLLVREFFISAIKHLSELQNIDWARNFFAIPDDTMLQSLSLEEVDIILENLMNANQIDYHIENILGCIAKSYTKKIIEFFGKRLKVKKDISKYEATPFEFCDHKLLGCLSQDAKLIVEITRSWFGELSDNDKILFRFNVGHFLKTVFPKFPNNFEEELLKLVHCENDDDLYFVIAILENYSGEIFLYNICKEIIKTLPLDSEKLRDIRVVLDSTGMVSGEFGFAEFYKKRKEETKHWLNDNNEKVRNFTEKWHADLDIDIASEIQRAEEGIELRKHQYGENSKKD